MAISYRVNGTLAEKRYSYSRVQPIKKQSRKEASLPFRLVAAVLVAIASYVFLVGVSVLYVRQNTELMNMKKQQKALIAQNETLKLDVERLKSPERITTIASKQLGMTTARSNIYVTARTAPSGYSGYAYAK